MSAVKYIMYAERILQLSVASPNSGFGIFDKRYKKKSNLIAISVFRTVATLNIICLFIYLTKRLTHFSLLFFKCGGLPDGSRSKSDGVCGGHNFQQYNLWTYRGPVVDIVHWCTSDLRSIPNSGEV